MALLLAGLFFLIFSVVAAILSESDSRPLSYIIYLGVILLIIGWIYFMVLIYRIWRFSIYQSRLLNLPPSIESAGKAVGYLFIPFYNFYWIFIAYGKLPKDLNKIAGQKSINYGMNNGLGIAIAVLTLAGIIPLVGYFFDFLNAFILAPILISQALKQCREISAPDISDTAG